MKTIKFSIPTYGLILLAMLMALSGVGCEQDAKVELPLAVNDKALNLSRYADNTRVLVYSTGKWKAAFTEDIAWAEISEGTGSGNGDFILNWESNPRFARRATLRISTSKRSIDIMVTQSGGIREVQLLLQSEKMNHIAWAGSGNIDLLTNMTGDLLDEIDVAVDYLDGQGNVVEAEDAGSWISNVILSEGSVTYKVADNSSGNIRSARLRLSAFDVAAEVNRTTSTLIEQSNEQGYFTLAETEIELPGFAKAHQVGWECNLGNYLNEVEAEVVYDGSATGWISNVAFTPDAVQFDTTENSDGGVRTASINISLAYGSTNLTGTIKVAQDTAEEELTIEFIRGKLATAGESLLTRDFITCVAISDGGNPNAELNPFTTAYNQVDYTANATTAYVQSADGKYGFRIQTLTAGDNKFERYATMQISLKDLTLVREDDPVRYTLKGFSWVNNVIGQTGGSAETCLPKTKAITELTDDDIYTYVSLQDVELAVDYGNYMNINEVMAMKSDVVTSGTSNQTRCDCAPRILRDENNNMLRMLMNAQTPWRCIDEDVPHGSGSVKGVVVHTELTQYPGDSGPYQLRPLALGDIALSKADGSGFSTKLATWYGPAGRNYWTYEGTRVYTDSGKTTYMDVSKSNGVNQSDGFMCVTFSSTDPGHKAFRYNSPSTGWWNYTTSVGEYFYWVFSAEDVPSGSRPTLIFTAGTGNNNATATTFNNPCYWRLSYSTNGTDYATIEDITMYPCPDTSREYAVRLFPGGLVEYVIELPDAIAGQENVTLRLQATSKAAFNSSTGEPTNEATTGTNSYVRFGAITVKYNN